MRLSKFKRSIPVLLIILSISLAGCVWEADTKNEILKVKGTRYNLYEKTNVSCLLGIDIPGFFKYSGLLRDKLPAIESVTLEPKGGRKKRLIIKKNENPISLIFDRLSALPKLCQDGGTPRTADPELNFEVLWHTFNENYAFFDLRGVDWDAQYDIYRPQVTPDTTPEELFEVSINMLAAFSGDPHVLLALPDGTVSQPGFIEPAVRAALREEFENQNEIKDFEEYFDIQSFKVIESIIEEYLGGNFEQAANDVIFWGIINGSVGYLNIWEMDSFGNHDPDPDIFFLENSEIARQAMVQVMQDFKDVEAVIMDLRLNEGGQPWVLPFVNRFADQERPIASLKARAGDGFTEPQTIYTTPEGPFQFTRPVVVLTSGLTLSASEALAAGMRALPHVTIIGKRTAGALSQWFRQLPNGWLFSLSNDVLETPEGDIFEGDGIPPDIEVAFPFQKIRDTGIDTGIEQALLFLDKELHR